MSRAKKMDFFGIGISEFLFIIFFCLIFFKPEELPGIVRAILSHVKKFRTMSVKVKREIGDIYHREIESKFEEIKEEIEKDTYEFRSKLSEEYDDINHHLENVSKDLDVSKINNDDHHVIENVENSELKKNTNEASPNKSSNDIPIGNS